MGFYTVFKGTLKEKTNCTKCGMEMLMGQQARCLVPYGNPYCEKCMGELLEDMDRQNKGQLVNEKTVNG